MSFENTDLATLAVKLRSGDITAHSIMESCAENYQRTESELNVYKIWAGDETKDVANSVDSLLKLGYDLGPLMGLPASFTGTVALKTSSGLWPKDNVVSLCNTLDTPGLLARSIKDLAYGYRAIEPQLRKNKVELPTIFGLQGLRIGVPEHFFWNDVDESVATAVQHAMRLLEQAGAILVPITIPNCDEV